MTQEQDAIYRRQLTELQIMANYGHPIAALVLKRLRKAQDEVFAHLFGPRVGTGFRSLIKETADVG